MKVKVRKRTIIIISSHPDLSCCSLAPLGLKVYCSPPVILTHVFSVEDFPFNSIIHASSTTGFRFILSSLDKLFTCFLSSLSGQTGLNNWESTQTYGAVFLIPNGFVFCSKRQKYILDWMTRNWMSKSHSYSMEWREIGFLTLSC
jgi:hypothetical protein